MRFITLSWNSTPKNNKSTQRIYIFREKNQYAIGEHFTQPGHSLAYQNFTRLYIVIYISKLQSYK